MLSRLFAVLALPSMAAATLAGAAVIGQDKNIRHTNVRSSNAASASSSSGDLRHNRPRISPGGSGASESAPAPGGGLAATPTAPASPAPTSGGQTPTHPSVKPGAPTAPGGAAPTGSPRPPAPIGCTGPALTSQSQVQPNTTYCGGVDHSQISLANGDTWVDGEVSGASAGPFTGAVECRLNCTLVNMNIHDNPGAWAGIDFQFANNGGGSGTITGGRVTNNGTLGIGGAQANPLTISGVEIDHNGASANCGNEGGGFKGLNTHLHFTGNKVHDNNCTGIWLDINSANVEIDHNTVTNNASSGIFYEISHDALIHDNNVEGNGFRTNGNGCARLWDGGITIASSFNVQVYGNAVRGNCNGITGTQQNRSDSSPPAHLLQNLSIHNNTITGSGRTGVVADNGADLTTRNIVFVNNSFAGGAVLCGLAC